MTKIRLYSLITFVLGGIWLPTNASKSSTNVNLMDHEEKFRSPSVQKIHHVPSKKISRSRHSRQHVKNTSRQRRRQKEIVPKGAPSKGKITPTRSPSKIPTQSPKRIPTPRPSPPPSKQPVTSEPTKVLKLPTSPSPTSKVPPPSPTTTFFNATIAVNLMTSMKISEVTDLLIGIWKPISADIIKKVAEDLMLNLIMDDSGVNTPSVIDCQEDTSDLIEGGNCLQTIAFISGESFGSKSKERSRVLQHTSKIGKDVEAAIESRGYEELERSIGGFCEDDLICVMQAKVQKSNNVMIITSVGLFTGLVAGGLIIRNVWRRGQPRDRIYVHFPVPIVPSDDEEILEVASIKSW